MVRMFLNGQAMRGGEFHPLLGDSPFLGEVSTAPGHRFFSIRDVCPGLLPDPSVDTAIAGELYEVSLELLRDVVLPGEPPELEFGVIKLADGSPAFSMVLRQGELARDVHKEITELGGWRAYLATLGRTF
ncbi:allophanate hydrolase-related protein [Kitasatospora sp. LaBMicrA B282]|uniref:allophanate hydrolase-related protein n=1 Tax=Kitasatospora sp. LaBMicrA B282 TaxID=3420949 RepID=UPI003D1096F5